MLWYCIDTGTPNVYVLLNKIILLTITVNKRDKINIEQVRVIGTVRFQFLMLPLGKINFQAPIYEIIEMHFFSHGPVNLLVRGPVVLVGDSRLEATLPKSTTCCSITFSHTIIFFQIIFILFQSSQKCLSCTPSTDSAYYISIQQHLLCEGLNLLLLTLIRFTDTSRSREKWTNYRD